MMDSELINYFVWEEDEKELEKMTISFSSPTTSTHDQDWGTKILKAEKEGFLKLMKTEDRQIGFFRGEIFFYTLTDLGKDIIKFHRL
jgi:hypothetical protein